MKSLTGHKILKFYLICLKHAKNEIEMFSNILNVKPGQRNVGLVILRSITLRPASKILPSFKFILVFYDWTGKVKSIW